jgi:hypothetical protein
MEPFIEANKGLQGKLNGKTLGQLKKEFHESNPLITDEIKTQINATMNKIDPEFEMEVVTDEATGKQYIHLGGGRYAPYDGK